MKPIQTAFQCIALFLLWSDVTLSQWSKIFNQPVTCFTRIDTVIVAGSASNSVYTSTDQGRKWLWSGRGIYMPYITGLVTRIDSAAGAFSLIAGTTGGAYASTNLGGNWYPLSNGMVMARIGSMTADESTILAGTYDGTIYKTRNNGSSWTKTDSMSIPSFTVTSLAIARHDSGRTDWLAATSGGGAFRSIDTGASWQALSIGNSEKYINTLVVQPFFHGLRTQYIYAGTSNEGVLRSSDGGATWLPRNDGIGETTIAMLAIAMNVPGAAGPWLFAGTHSRGVYRSTDNGDTWHSYNFLLWERDVISLGVVTGIDGKDSLLFAGAGNAGWSCPLTEIATQALPATTIPGCAILDRNYPNPFRESTRITFQVTHSGYGRLAIYDMLGREVKTVSETWFEAGIHSAILDGGDIPSGVYVYRLEFSGTIMSKTCLLQR